MNDHHRQSLPEGGKARRVYLLVRDDVLSGALPPGALLEPELRLADRHGVSRVTIRRALDALEADGLIVRRAGSGTFVTDQPAAPTMAADMASLIPQIAEMGKHAARLLSFSYCAPPKAVARALGPGQVQRAVRVRSAAGQPFSHLTTYVPEPIAAHYSESDLADTPLYQLLERSGVRVSEASQSVSASLAGPEVAEALEVSTGSALLWVRRVVRDETGRGVEYLSALYRPDRYELAMSLSRVGDQDTRHWEPVIEGEG